MLRRIAVTALLAASALAAAPATGPVTIPANQDTPQGTLKLMSSAMDSGNVQQIKSVIATTNPSEDKLVDAMAQMAKSIAHLKGAALKAFGEKGSTQLNGDPAARQEEMARIDQSKVEITGDTASITLDPSQKKPLVLKKINNQWKIPMAEMTSSPNSTNVDQILEAVKLQSEVFDDVAKETEAGKYKTENDLRQALEGKMMKAALAHAQAATRPATTRPTTQPAK